MKKIMFSLLSAFLLSVFLFSCSKNGLHNSDDNAVRDAGKTAVLQKENTMQRSIYQAGGAWTDQYGKSITLNQLTGKVQVTAMIFTHCGYACPKIIANMKAIEEKLPRNMKNKVGFLLITFDTEKDTAARLNQYAGQLQLGNRWTLLHGSADEVRIMSMLLQVKYSPLEGGGFNHSNVITILDENGAVSQKIEGLDINIEQAVDAVKETVKG